MVTVIYLSAMSRPLIGDCPRPFSVFSGKDEGHGGAGSNLLGYSTVVCLGKQMSVVRVREFTGGRNGWLR